MGKRHSEEAVIPILLRKGIIVKEYDNDRNLIKQIGVPVSLQVGIRILGKLDFMRIKGWKVVRTDQMVDTNTKTQRNGSFKKEKQPVDSMKDSFKKKKKVLALKKV